MIGERSIIDLAKPLEQRLNNLGVISYDVQIKSEVGSHSPGEHRLRISGSETEMNQASVAPAERTDSCRQQTRINPPAEENHWVAVRTQGNQGLIDHPYNLRLIRFRSVTAEVTEAYAIFFQQRRAGSSETLKRDGMLVTRR